MAAMPRPDRPPEALLAMPTYALSLLGRQARAEMAATLPDGLRLGHLAVLGALADQSGQAQNELSQALAIHPTDMVALVEDLLARRLVTRDVDRSDRRRRLIGITQRGRRLVSRATSDSERVAARLLENLDQQDQTMVTRLLRQALSE